MEKLVAKKFLTCFYNSRLRFAPKKTHLPSSMGQWIENNSRRRPRCVQQQSPPLRPESRGEVYGKCWNATLRSLRSCGSRNCNPTWFYLTSSIAWRRRGYDRRPRQNPGRQPLYSTRGGPFFRPPLRNRFSPECFFAPRRSIRIRDR